MTSVFWSKSTNNGIFISFWLESVILEKFPVENFYFRYQTTATELPLLNLVNFWYRVLKRFLSFEVPREQKRINLYFRPLIPPSWQVGDFWNQQQGCHNLLCLQLSKAYRHRRNKGPKVYINSKKWFLEIWSASVVTDCV